MKLWRCSDCGAEWLPGDVGIVEVTHDGLFCRACLAKGQRSRMKAEWIDRPPAPAWRPDRRYAR